MKNYKKLLVGGLAFIALTYLSGKPAQSSEKRLDRLEKIILSQTLESKTVMFGEQHGTYTEDSEFFLQLLPRLKKQGFHYLALEIPRKKPLGFHKILHDYAYGKIKRKEINPTWISFENLEAAGWFNLIDKARSLGLKIICYDGSNYRSWNEREEQALKNLRELIFENDPKAKVIIYCGAIHINEEISNDFTIQIWELKEALCNQIKQKPEFKCLGYLLNKFTKGKNLTVDLTRYRKEISCDIRVFKK